jgi:hypothetical protein
MIEGQTDPRGQFCLQSARHDQEWLAFSSGHYRLDSAFPDMCIPSRFHDEVAFLGCADLQASGERGQKVALVIK